MMPLSRRYLRPMLLIMAPVLIPVFVHSYKGLEHDDCPGAAKLFPDGVPDVKRDRWMKETFRAVQWADGGFPCGEAIGCEFLVVRSYDPKRLYHRPYNSMSEGAAAGLRVQWLPAGSESIPVHIVEYEKREQARLSGYLLVYNSRPVDDPYSAQLAAFPLQLVSGSRPMTLFLITATGPHDAEAELAAPVRQWLAAQWQRYRAACSVEAGPR